MINRTQLDVLLDEAGRRGFTWHQFRVDRHGPEVLAGAFHWRRCADVVVLTDDQGSHAYRTPTEPEVDVFAPSHVHWWYGHNPAQPGTSMVWVLRALLTLPEPDDTLPLLPAPDGTGVPGTRTPVRIRQRLAT